MSDVGGQRCPDSVRIYCAVSVSQNLKFSVGTVFECQDFEFELDFDRQIPDSNSGQNPDSAVRRRLVYVMISWLLPVSLRSSWRHFHILPSYLIGECALIPWRRSRTRDDEITTIKVTKIESIVAIIINRATPVTRMLQVD